MSFVERLKAMFGGKPKGGPAPFAILEKQVDALEAKLVITEHAKRIEGGLDGFDMAYDEVRQMAAGYVGEGRRPEPALDILLKRLELCHDAAHLIREEDPQKRKQLATRFLATFKETKETIPFRTKTKYQRIRIDLESGRQR